MEILESNIIGTVTEVSDNSLTILDSQGLKHTYSNITNQKVAKNDSINVNDQLGTFDTELHYEVN